MTRRTVVRFFSVLFVLAGALLVLRAVAFGGFTGASVQEDTESFSLALRHVEARMEGTLVHVMFTLLTSQQESEVAYVFDSRGTTLRTGTFPVISEPGRAGRQGFRVVLPEKGEDLFVTVSVSDGGALALKRVPVVSERVRGDISRGAVSLIGIGAFACFVLGYFHYRAAHRMRVRGLAQHTKRHVTFRSAGLR